MKHHSRQGRRRRKSRVVNSQPHTHSRMLHTDQRACPPGQHLQHDEQQYRLSPGGAMAVPSSMQAPVESRERKRENGTPPNAPAEKTRAETQQRGADATKLGSRRKPRESRKGTQHASHRHLRAQQSEQGDRAHSSERRPLRKQREFTSGKRVSV